MKKKPSVPPPTRSVVVVSGVFDGGQRNELESSLCYSGFDKWTQTIQTVNMTRHTGWVCLHGESTHLAGRSGDDCDVCVVAHAAGLSLLDTSGDTSKRHSHIGVYVVLHIAIRSSAQTATTTTDGTKPAHNKNKTQITKGRKNP